MRSLSALTGLRSRIGAVTIAASFAATITLTSAPSVAGVGTITAGETHAEILARADAGTATTDGPGAVTIAASITGASDPVVAAQTATVRYVYSAPDAADVTVDLDAGVVQSAPATAPAQFGAGGWSVADLATTGDARITIITLPDDGGAAITDLEYRIGGGSWVSMARTTTGTHDVSGLVDDVAVTLTVRAVNSVGNGPESAGKTVTPTATPVAAPSNTVAPEVTGNTGLGDTLVTTTGTWSGSGITYTYQWQRDTVDIGGATSATYTIGAADDNASVRCGVTATNGGGAVAANSNGITVDDFAVPVITGGPTISGTETVGEVLTASAASVTGNPTPARTWQWVNSVTGDISGATSTTYALQAADEGDTITVRQIETNGIGADTATSTATGAIAAATGGTLALTEFTMTDQPVSMDQPRGTLLLSVPFEVTGPDGQAVEASVVDAAGTVVRDWSTLGTIASGTLTASLTMFPLPESCTRRVRLASTPGTVVSSTGTFFACDGILSLGQSEDAHIYKFDETTADAWIDYKAALLASLTRHGRTGLYKPTTKVAGTDAWPAGVTQTTMDGIETVTIGAGYDVSVPFEDWSMVATDGQAMELVVALDGVTVRNCDWSMVNHTGGPPNRFISISATADDVLIEYCTLRARPVVSFQNMVDGTIGAAIRQELSGNSITGSNVHIRRNRILNMPADGIKSAGAYVYENLYAAPSNIPVGVPNWNSSTTYSTGDPVIGTDGRYYYSNTDGNLNNGTFPGASQSNTNWRSYDPHADPVNYYASLEPSFFMANVIDLRPEPAYLDVSLHAEAQAVGTQSGIYVTPNSGGPQSGAVMDQITITRNIFLGFGIGPFDPIDIVRNSPVADWTAPVVYNNFIQPSSRGISGREYIYITDADVDGTDVTLGRNFDYDTGLEIGAPVNGTITLTDQPIDPKDFVEHLWLTGINGENGDPALVANAGNLNRAKGGDAGMTAAMVKMSQALAVEAPNVRSVVAHSTFSGTSPESISDNSDNRRRSENEIFLKEAAFGDLHPSIVTASWFAAPGAQRSAYGRYIAPIFVGVQADGGAYSNPHVYLNNSGGGNSSIAMDFSVADMVDYTKTMFAARGPHQFVNGLVAEDVSNSNGQKQEARLAWRDLVAGLPDLFTPLALEGINYRQGDNDATPNGGASHPNYLEKEGLEWKAALDALAFSQGLGRVRVPTPEFDRIEWATDGSYVEIWSGQGDLSTTRLLQSLSAITSVRSHRGDVSGFRFDPDSTGGLPFPLTATEKGEIAGNATVVNGRVRITPNTGSFSDGDTIGFGNFGGNTDLGTFFPEDIQDNIHRDMPVLATNAGPYGGPGLPVRPLPTITLVASGITGGGGGGFAIKDAASDASFTGPDWPAATSGWTMRLDANIAEGSGLVNLVSYTGLSLTVQLDTRTGKRGMRFSMRDGTGSTVFNAQGNLSAGSVPASRGVLVVSVTQDRGDGTAECKVFFDGVEQQVETAGAGATPTFDTARSLELLDATGADMSLYALDIYHDYASDGDVSGLTAVHSVAGAAANWNTPAGDLVKAGTGVFT